MDVESTFRKDHPFDLKRPLRDAGRSGNFEHLVTVVPVKFRPSSVETCFLARPDVSILRQSARTRHPGKPGERRDTGIKILKLTLGIGDPVEIGPGLMVLSVMDVSRGKARFRLTPSEGLLLELSQLDDSRELNLRAIVELLERGLDYRSRAL
jgi:hypothetical protein